MGDGLSKPWVSYLWFINVARLFSASVKWDQFRIILEPIGADLRRFPTIPKLAETLENLRKPAFLLVEAAGIEPASADTPPSDLHAYFIY